MKSFHKYYSGEKTAPILTICIGGNHEASNHLQELELGGWLAPNIYYLGYSGAVKFGLNPDDPDSFIRIGGLGGIYEHKDYKKTHFEKVPFKNDELYSVYHQKIVDTWRLKQLKYDENSRFDFFMSHDWVSNIAFHNPNYRNSELNSRHSVKK